MNIFERISLAARVAVHGEKALATIRPTWDTMQPSYSPINYEAMVRSGWRKNELIMPAFQSALILQAKYHLGFTREMRRWMPTIRCRGCWLTHARL